MSAIFLQTGSEPGHSPDSHITSTEVQNFWNKDPTGSVVANRSCQTVASNDHQASAVQAAVAPAGCRTHLLHHFLFHFLRSGFSLVRGHHPSVSIWVHYCPATIAPKHVHYLALGCGCETDSLGDHFIHVLHVEK